MIVGFSTSSPLASVCILGDSGKPLWAKSADAPGRSSEVCIGLLEEGLGATGVKLETIDLFVSDHGPGSFTGVRVGIVLAKTFAWNFGVQCAGIDAFDLISLDHPVAIPSRRGEYFLRAPGRPVTKTELLPAGTVGYGFEGDSCYPEAYRLKESVNGLVRVSPEALMPEYRAEPSISMPKRPLSRVSD